MGRGKNLSPKKRALLVQARTDGMSFREIAKKFNVSRNAVRNAVKIFKDTGHYKDKPRSGRPKKTDHYIEKTIQRLSEGNRKLTAPAIKSQLETYHGLSLSVKTVQRILIKGGLMGRVARKTPLISKKNQKLRLQFASRYCHWTSWDWAKVLWSDESKFNLSSSDGRTYVRRRSGEELSQKCTVPTVKHAF